MIAVRKMFSITPVEVLHWVVRLLGCLATTGIVYTHSWNSMKATISSAAFTDCMSRESILLKRRFIDESIFYFETSVRDDLIESCSLHAEKFVTMLSYLVVGSIVCAMVAIFATVHQVVNLRYNKHFTKGDVYDPDVPTVHRMVGQSGLVDHIQLRAGHDHGE